MLNPNYNHPGEVIQKEFLEPYNISMRTLCKGTFLPLTRVNAIVNGKEKVNADIALRLAKFFGNSARDWLWLQIEFDIRKENTEHGKEFQKIKTVEKSAA